MASVAATVSSSSFHHLTFLTKSRHSLSLFKPFHSTLLPRISASSQEFNISFAPPKPKPKPPQQQQQQQKSLKLHENDAGRLFIPWIVREEDGQLKLQSQPSARLLNELGIANTQKPKPKTAKNAKNAKKEGRNASANPKQSAPRYSKAARRFYNEHFREQPQRLSKVLAAAGVASRRSSEELIFEGKVRVNGSLCKTPQTRVDPAKDIIYVNGSRLPKKLPPKLYFALNKPKGYICSAGEKETKSVLSLFDDYFESWNKKNPGVPQPRLFTVGRLDVATSGLLIVTNDGDFAQALAHPSSELSKEYIAAIDGEVHKRHLIAISEGTVIEGVHCTPDSVELLPRQPDITRPRIRVVVHEGRNHEVRELVKNAGLKIHALKRVRIGGYRLPTDLGLGKHVDLRMADLKALGWKA